MSRDFNRAEKIIYDTMLISALKNGLALSTTAQWAKSPKKTVGVRFC